jgi:hypothetical protein
MGARTQGTHRRWTDAELAILRDWYPREGAKRTVKALHALNYTDRTVLAVYVKAHAEGLRAGKNGEPTAP